MVKEKHQYAALLEGPYIQTVFARAYQPLEWVHPDWIVQAMPANYPITTTCIKTNRYIAQQLGLPTNFEFETKTSFNKFLLLAPSLIRQVIGLLGLCCYQDALKKLISKQVKHVIDERIGCNASHIVEKKLPFMLAQFPDEMRQTKQAFTSANTLPNFLNIGLAIFKQLCTQSNHYDYFRFMLPPSVEEIELDYTLSSDSQNKTTLLIRKLAIEIDRTCTSLLK